MTIAIMKAKFSLLTILAVSLLSSAVHAGLQPGANVLPYEIRNTSTGEEYCQMCRYSDSAGTIAAYGKLHDEAFWRDLKRLQVIRREHRTFGFFGQILDSTDSAAIQTEAKKHGITLPLVYSVEPEWEKVYQVGGVSRTIYYSNNFKILWAGVGLDDASLAAIEARIKADPRP